MKQTKSIKTLKILFKYNFTINLPKNAIIIMAMIFPWFPMISHDFSVILCLSRCWLCHNENAKTYNELLASPKLRRWEWGAQAYMHWHWHVVLGACEEARTRDGCFKEGAVHSRWGRPTWGLYRGSIRKIIEKIPK